MKTKGTLAKLGSTVARAGLGLDVGTGTNRQIVSHSSNCCAESEYWFILNKSAETVSSTPSTNSVNKLTKW